MKGDFFTNLAPSIDSFKKLALVQQQLATNEIESKTHKTPDLPSKPPLVKM